MSYNFVKEFNVCCTMFHLNTLYDKELENEIVCSILRDDLLCIGVLSMQICSIIKLTLWPKLSIALSLNSLTRDQKNYANTDM